MKKILGTTLVAMALVSGVMAETIKLKAVSTTGASIPTLPSFVLNITSVKYKGCKILGHLALDKTSSRAVLKDANAFCDKNKIFKDDAKITLVDEDGKEGVILNKVSPNSTSEQIIYVVEPQRSFTVLIN